jgi:acyl-CoA thioesterase
VANFLADTQVDSATSRRTSITVQVHAFAPETEWMLADGVMPIAQDGMLGCVSRLWTEDGRLVATGTSKHLCRPNPGYEQELARARELGLI